MLRLTTNRKSRIPHRLAIFAAVLLVVSSLTGIGNSMIPTGDDASRIASLATAEEAMSSLHGNGKAKVKKNKGFKISLFLLRNH